MLAEIDTEMKKKNLKGVVVIGNSTYNNPTLYYVTGGHLSRGGSYFYVLDEEPMLVVNGVDLGSAEKGKVKNVQTYVDLGYSELVEKHGYGKGDALFYKKILADMGIGKDSICFYGTTDRSNVVFTDRLRRYGLKVKGDSWPRLFDILRETKEPWEIEKIKQAGRATEKVIEETIYFLQSCAIKNDKLQYEGENLTVGEAKRFIREKLAREYLFLTRDVDFAVGEKGSDPHYAGEDNDIVFVNRPILLDVYPQHEGAYWFDTTRTFVIGEPSKKVERLFVDVLGAQEFALENTRAGVSSVGLMKMICDYFEERGHETYQSYRRKNVPESEMKSGFMHGLGHGVGLSDAEQPYIYMGHDTALKENSVITLEPGLYYPGVGGIRLEDVVIVKRNGIDNLSSLEKKLVYC